MCDRGVVFCSVSSLSRAHMWFRLWSSPSVPASSYILMLWLLHKMQFNPPISCFEGAIFLFVVKLHCVFSYGKLAIFLATIRFGASLWGFSWGMMGSLLSLRLQPKLRTIHRIYIGNEILSLWRPSLGVWWHSYSNTTLIEMRSHLDLWGFLKIWL